MQEKTPHQTRTFPYGISTVQGAHLVLSKFGCNTQPFYRHEDNKRKLISTFSRASAKRLSCLLASLDWSQKYYFCTLTYPPMCRENGQASKLDLNRFFKSLARLYPTSSAVWRIEAHKSGWPHYHLLIAGLPMLHRITLSDKIQRIWARSINYNHTTIFELTPIQTSTGAILYLTAGHHTKTSQVFDKPVGRYWGVHRRNLLPWALKLDFQPSPQFIRIVRRVWQARELKRVSFYRARGKKAFLRSFDNSGPDKLFHLDLTKLIQRLTKANIPYSL